jgi:hypothetical protein
VPESTPSLVERSLPSRARLLERPVADWPRLGEQVRDGRASISGDDPALAAQMRPDVARDRGGHASKIDDFLARLTVEVRDGLPETSLRLLSELLSIPAASCQAHFFALQDALGVLSQPRALQATLRGLRIMVRRLCTSVASKRAPARACPTEKQAPGRRDRGLLLRGHRRRLVASPYVPARLQRRPLQTIRRQVRLRRPQG